METFTAGSCECRGTAPGPCSAGHGHVCEAAGARVVFSTAEHHLGFSLLSLVTQKGVKPTRPSTVLALNHIRQNIQKLSYSQRFRLSHVHEWVM